jgi:hypothetical protein
MTLVAAYHRLHQERFVLADELLCPENWSRDIQQYL